MIQFDEFDNFGESFTSLLLNCTTAFREFSPFSYSSLFENWVGVTFDVWLNGGSTLFLSYKNCLVKGHVLILQQQ